MKRILIIGPSGAGKSTASFKVQEKLGHVPIYHMDKLFWQAGWQAVGREELQEKVAMILLEDSWIIEGNYGSTLEQRLACADTVLVLDYPRYIYFSRIFKRFFMYRNKERPDMTDGCREKLDWEFIHYVWTFPQKMPEIYQKLQQIDAKVTIHMFKKPRELASFIELL